MFMKTQIPPKFSTRKFMCEKKLSETALFKQFTLSNLNLSKKVKKRTITKEFKC